MRILIVRLTALGDVIHGLPVLCALRRAMPDAFLGWIVEGRAGDLLVGHPDLDELIRVPRRWLKSIGDVWRLRKHLQSLRFDIAIDLQSLTKSSAAAWLSGASRRIGKGGKDGRELSKWFNNELIEPKGDHVIDHYLDMLRPLGITNRVVDFGLREGSEEQLAMESHMARLGLHCDRFALLNPGAGWPSKIWPAERYGDVANYVSSNHGMPSVVAWSGDTEKRLAETIVEESRGSALLAPPTDIKELAALARRASFFLGSDTGPMHLAVAVGTPSISLHGPSLAEWCGAYGPENIRLQVTRDTGRMRHKQSTDDSAMRAITTDYVCQACDRILEVGRRSSQVRGD